MHRRKAATYCGEESSETAVPPKSACRFSMSQLLLHALPSNFQHALHATYEGLQIAPTGLRWYDPGL